MTMETGKMVFLVQRTFPVLALERMSRMSEQSHERVCNLHEVHS